MNGQNIPADASCATCRWYAAFPQNYRRPVFTEGACYLMPPAVVADGSGVRHERPNVDSTDLCSQWQAVRP